MKTKLPYQPDILGEDYEQLAIEMNPDVEGKVFCTLIHRKSDQVFPRTMLYVHGFNDYFFQKELADQCIRHGYNFYAVDLRKSGRSIRPWQTPYEIYSISDYFEDLDTVVKIIYRENPGKLIFNGHSTGGLTLSLYVASRKMVCAALILNSPFLAFNRSYFTRLFAIPFVATLASFFPKMNIKSQIPVHYGTSLHKGGKGEWDYEKQWKAEKYHMIHACWVKGIYHAQRKLKKGLSIQCPILVMRSEKSVYGEQWKDEFMQGDSILNVNEIGNRAGYLGSHIKQVAFNGGLHDLILSKRSVRENVYAEMFAWLGKVVR